MLSMDDSPGVLQIYTVDPFKPWEIMDVTIPPIHTVNFGRKRKKIRGKVEKVG